MKTTLSVKIHSGNMQNYTRADLAECKPNICIIQLQYLSFLVSDTLEDSASKFKVFLSRDDIGVKGKTRKVFSRLRSLEHFCLLYQLLCKCLTVCTRKLSTLLELRVSLRQSYLKLFRIFQTTLKLDLADNICRTHFVSI